MSVLSMHSEMYIQRLSEINSPLSIHTISTSLYLLLKLINSYNAHWYKIAKVMFERQTGVRQTLCQGAMYGAYNMTKLFEFELCKFELLTSFI